MSERCASWVYVISSGFLCVWVWLAIDDGSVARAAAAASRRSSACPPHGPPRRPAGSTTESEGGGRLPRVEACSLKRNTAAHCSAHNLRSPAAGRRPRPRRRLAGPHDDRAALTAGRDASAARAGGAAYDCHGCGGRHALPTGTKCPLRAPPPRFPDDAPSPRRRRAACGTTRGRPWPESAPPPRPRWSTEATENRPRGGWRAAVACAPPLALVVNFAAWLTAHAAAARRQQQTVGSTKRKTGRWSGCLQVAAQCLAARWR